MRIGLIIYGRIETISGGYLYDRKLVAHLRQMGDTVEIVSLPWLGYGRALLHNFSPELRQRLSQARFDLLLQDELNHPSLFWLNRQLKGKVPYPIISVVHHLRCSEMRPAWQNGLYRLVERQYLDSVDGFLFNSETTRAVVEELVGKRPYHIAYPAGDQFQPEMSDSAIRARAYEPGPLRILFVGNVIPRKGLHVLLDALARLPRESWRLDVVGDTAVAPFYTQSIHAQIREENLSPNVTLTGSLPDDELFRWMEQSHLLIVPSSYEGYGIVYLEGMSFGLPAIAGRGGAAHEIITDGVNGFLVDHQQTNQLTSHILNLHQNREKLAEMSLAAHQRYLAHPTWSDSMAGARKFIHRDWRSESED
ncbi:MAG: glycosyltransferase family 4 protein [Ardenticatenaceae bacterium]|nr:glycosyltransferase family 4 protein [Ardenticatenaceae bacterium]MCB9445375.1 glycosyltransferase family 4 protein [Ardenticatenaceae bacterium]